MMPLIDDTGTSLNDSRSHLWHKVNGDGKARAFEFSGKRQSTDNWNHKVQLTHHDGMAPPNLAVSLDEKTKYTHQTIGFTVYISQMRPSSLFSIAVDVTTPSNQTIYGQSRSCCKPTVSGDAVITGKFSTAKEIGRHVLTVSIFSPSPPADDTDVWGKFGNLSRATTFVVNKNFQMDRVKPSLKIFPAFYSGGNDINTTAWGITSGKATDHIFYTDAGGNGVGKIDIETQHSIRLNSNVIAKPLKNPNGICVDQANRRLIIADTGNRRICFRDLDGVHLGSFGGPYDKNGSKPLFDSPHDVAVTEDGDRIAVVDQGSGAVSLFDKHGYLIKSTNDVAAEPNKPNSGIKSPRGIAFGVNDSKLFISDVAVNNVLEIPLSLENATSVFSDQKPCKVDGVYVDASNTLIVCDSGRNEVCYKHLNTAGNYFRIYRVGKTQLQKPVNVTGMSDERIVILNKQGVVHIF